MPVRLTDKAIARALRERDEGKRVELSDEGLPGLRFRAGTAGRGTWVLACRDKFGRMRRFQVGDWPKDGLAVARDAARDMRVKVRGGADPIAEAKRTRAIGREAKAGVGTLDALIKLYTTKVASKLKSWPETRRRVEMVFKDHLHQPIPAITRQDLQITADSYPSPQQASGAVNGLRPVLKWAAGRTYLADASLLEVRVPAAKSERDRVVTREELGKLLPALSASDRPYAAALRFMLLTLARREEVCGARWRDVDLQAGTWRIPAGASKNGFEHIVPLSAQADALLRSLPQRGSGALVFGSRTGGHLTNWDRATKVIMEASGTSGWTRHDLRRTGATMLGDMGETPEIVEAALNHVVIKSRVASIYNRSRYRPQVAVALQRLADALDGIVAGGAVVVPIRAVPA